MNFFRRGFSIFGSFNLTCPGINYYNYNKDGGALSNNLKIIFIPTLKFIQKHKRLTSGPDAGVFP